MHQIRCIELERRRVSVSCRCQAKPHLPGSQLAAAEYTEQLFENTPHVAFFIEIIFYKKRGENIQTGFWQKFKRDEFSPLMTSKPLIQFDRGLYTFRYWGTYSDLKIFHIRTFSFCNICIESTNMAITQTAIRL